MRSGRELRARAHQASATGGPERRRRRSRLPHVEIDVCEREPRTKHSSRVHRQAGAKSFNGATSNLKPDVRFAGSKLGQESANAFNFELGCHKLAGAG
jgi:hypothetical protein